MAHKIRLFFALLSSRLTFSSSRGNVRKCRAALQLVTWAFLALAPWACAQDYVWVRIPSLGKLTSASAINSSGQVVGSAGLPSFFSHAFLWHKGSPIQDLGTLGGSTSVAYGINAAGQVVGSAEDSLLNDHAFLWSPGGGMLDLNPSTIDGRAFGVNSAGETVGSFLPANSSIFVIHAFLWTPAGGILDLGSGANNGGASGINASGEVVGSVMGNDGFQHAFLWTPLEGLHDLGTLGGPNSSANAINDNGDIVGGSDTADGAKHAFRWTRSGGMQDLGLTAGFANSSAYAINGLGQIVGAAWTAGAKGVPLLWTPDGAIKVFGPFGKTGVEEAVAINDAGQILASVYIYDRGYSSFLISPLTHVALVSSSNPSASGAPLTFTVTVKSSVAGSPPDGEVVRLNEGPTNLGQARLNKGLAVFHPKNLKTGTHAVRATYAGDLNYDLSKSSVLEQVVNAP